MLENVYAEALKRMIQEGKTPKDAVAALESSLKARGRTALLSRIAHAFERIAARERMRNVLTLSVASKEHAAKAKKQTADILHAMHVDAEDVETRVDEGLVGGWRLEGRETLHDASFKKHLLSIYNRIIQ